MLTTIAPTITSSNINWYTKEFGYFLSWIKNTYPKSIAITPSSLHPLINSYLSRLKELGCEDAAIDVIQTALYGYCELADVDRS